MPARDESVSISFNPHPEHSSAPVKSDMNRYTVVSTYPSTEWGPVSFPAHLHDALSDQHQWDGDLIAPPPSSPGSTPELLALPDGETADYSAAAQWIAESSTDVVGLYPHLGDVSEFRDLELAKFLTRIKTPVVTTLHALSPQPALPYKEAVHAVVYLSDRVVVMTDRAAERLADDYDAHPSKIEVIPHGIPELPLVSSERYKGTFGLSERTVVLTAGFVGPGKGIEFVLETITEVVDDHPEVMYLVLGPIHPELSTYTSERFRRDLHDRVESLGLTNHVRFVDTVPDREDLVDYMRASDVYVAPYPECDESATATLAYAVGTGRAIVATPSPYAEELFGGSDGHVVPYGDTVAHTQSLRRLIADEEARQILNRRAHRLGQSMTWAKVAREYAALFDAVARGGRQFDITRDGPHFPASPPPLRWP